MLDYMRAHGWWTLVTDNEGFGELEPVRLDAEWPGQGLVTFRMLEAEAQAWRSRGVAVVNISSEGGAYGFPRVIPDNAQVGQRAAEHLVSLGLRDFAYIGRAASLYNVESWIPGARRYAQERWQGFSAHLTEHGIPARSFFLSPHPLWEDASWKRIQDEVGGFLKTLPKPCGIFATDDPLAAVVQHACAAYGYRVPDDLPLLGFGNDRVYCQSTTPALSSVDYPGREIGFQAARLLAAQLAGEAPEEIEVHVPVGFVVARESTDFLAFDDVEVARLVRWIRLRALTDPVQVSDVQAQSSVSMTALKERFHAALGHGPKREIMETRLRHLQGLLSTTDLPLERIADSMGFPSVESLHRFLLRQTGQRAEAFRR